MMETDLEQGEESFRETDLDQDLGGGRLERVLDRVDAMVTAHPHVAALCAAALAGAIGYWGPRRRSSVVVETYPETRTSGRARVMAKAAARRAGQAAMTAAFRSAGQRLMSRY